MKLFVGYSKVTEQPQSSVRPICHSHTMTNTGREPATIRIATYRSSPRYTLRHGIDNNHHVLPGFTKITQHKDCDKGYNTSTYIS